ncbi:helix-turn-helix domain-containing protein [uncultured Roseobacter sp.]|uniref:winged helix-turn-helix domain-containing protein n=1 Tax=uncultured Roseobacter sp. TaxID=114847 RepID=UPI0026128646|nr:helix-turn-helix domain-containing protein [uncultured Roseobacter sp.]
MLTKTETALLKFLLRLQDGCNRERLMQEVLGYHPAAETHALETHVWRIRRKIEADPKSPRILISIEGGYRLDLTECVHGAPRWVYFFTEMTKTCSVLNTYDPDRSQRHSRV